MFPADNGCWHQRSENATFLKPVNRLRGLLECRKQSLTESWRDPSAITFAVAALNAQLGTTRLIGQPNLAAGSTRLRLRIYYWQIR